MTTQVTLGELNRRFDHAYERTHSLADHLEIFTHDLARFIITDGQMASAARSGHCFYCGAYVEDDLCPGCGARNWDRQKSI